MLTCVIVYFYELNTVIFDEYVKWNEETKDTKTDKQLIQISVAPNESIFIFKLNLFSYDYSTSLQPMGGAIRH